MGNECSTCACNDQKEIDDSTALNLQKREKQSMLQYEEKEYINKLIYNTIYLKIYFIIIIKKYKRNKIFAKSNS